MAIAPVAIAEQMPSILSMTNISSDQGLNPVVVIVIDVCVLNLNIPFSYSLSPKDIPFYVFFIDLNDTKPSNFFCFI
jgi:hypothetical protein